MSSDRRRLVDQLEHSHLVDSLPYVDQWSPALAAQVDAIVRAEMARFAPRPDYLAPLGDAPDLVGTEVTRVDIERMQRGEPMPELDLDYTVKSLRLNASERDVAEYQTRSQIAAAYEQARIDALELSSRFGEAVWHAKLVAAERLLAQEKAALKATERAVAALNAERREAQTRTRERLFVGEREFLSLCAKNVQLSAVVRQLQAEIDELLAMQQAAGQRA